MKLIFILASSRSGSTFLNQILGKNSKVSIFNELHFFDDNTIKRLNDVLLKKALVKKAEITIARIKRDFWAKPIKEDILEAERIVSEYNVSSFKQLYLAILKEYSKEKSEYCVDQTGRNIIYADRLISEFDEAYFIHLIRDPRGFLASQKYRWKQRFNGAKNIPLKEAVRVLINYNPITLSFLWKKQNSLKNQHLIKIRYEDLVKDFENSITNLLNILHLDFDKCMLDVNVITSSFDSDGRKGVIKANIAKWKKVLNTNEIYLSQKICSQVLSKYNYEKIEIRPNIGILLTIFRSLFSSMFGVVLNPKLIITYFRNL